MKKEYGDVQMILSINFPTRSYLSVV